MNISSDKPRTPLGVALFQLPDWHRAKIKKRLTGVGLSEGRWRTIYERTEAYLLPAFVQEIIKEEMPEAVHFFELPQPATS